MIAPVIGPLPAVSHPTITEYRIPNTGTPTNAIALGPDGALWFPASEIVKGISEFFIDRMNIKGVVTNQYPLPDIDYDDASYITAGIHGALWFAVWHINGPDSDHLVSIDRMTTRGKVTAQYYLPDTRSGLSSITFGPDKALWFTVGESNVIGRMSTSGKLSEYASATPPASTDLQSITPGPGGALWFVDSQNNLIGRITTAGKITEYPLPRPRSSPIAITTGPDGAMWFTEIARNAVGRITVKGMITNIYHLPKPDYAPYGIATGPDGALWIAELGNSNGNGPITRMTTAGKVSQYFPPTTNAQPMWIIGDSPSAMWFTESNVAKIGKVTLP